MMSLNILQHTKVCDRKIERKVFTCKLHLSNSSMQQRPPSANTRAPASSIHSPENLVNVLNAEKGPQSRSWKFYKEEAK